MLYHSEMFSVAEAEKERKENEERQHSEKERTCTDRYIKMRTERVRKCVKKVNKRHL